MMVSMMADAKKEDYRKPAYDGRLVFYPSLMKLDDNISQAVMMNNNQLIYKLLRTMYSRVAPYIKREHSEELKAALADVYKRMNGSIDRRFKGQIESKVEEALMLINDKIHLYAKDMFIPQGSEESDDVNWEEIMGA